MLHQTLARSCRKRTCSLDRHSHTYNIKNQKRLFDYFFGVNSLLDMMWSICLISSMQAKATKAKVPAVLVGMLSRCCN